MLEIIWLVMKARKLVLLRGIGTLFLCITFIILVFLNLSSYHHSKAFSNMYIVKVMGDRNATSYHVGYFHMCQAIGTPSYHNGSSIVCKPLKDFANSQNTAYNFAKHVVRPYFVVIATIFTGFAIPASITCIITGNVNFYVNITSLTLTSLATLFTMLGACWQQVATQAAVVLLENKAKRGYRAAGMVWSSLAMLILTLMAQVTQLNRPQLTEKKEQDAESVSSTIDTVASVCEKINDHL